MALYLVECIESATFPSLPTRYRLTNNLILEITFLNLSRDLGTYQCVDGLKSYQEKIGL